MTHRFLPKLHVEADSWCDNMIDVFFFLSFPFDITVFVIP